MPATIPAQVHMRLPGPRVSVTRSASRRSLWSFKQAGWEQERSARRQPQNTSLTMPVQTRLPALPGPKASVSFKNKPVELHTCTLGARPASLPAASMELRDNVCNHPSASAHEAPSAVRSNSELDSVSFKNTPVVFQTGWLEGRTASSPAASKNWRDNASVRVGLSSNGLPVSRFRDK